MKVNYILCLSLIQGALSHVIQERAACQADNCVRAVVGLQALSLGDPIIQHRLDCSSFQATTVTPVASIVTQYITTTLLPRPVPSYAAACSSSNRYASACSCWGITASVSTAPTPVTTVTMTVTVTPVPPHSCNDPGTCNTFKFIYDPSCGSKGRCLCGYNADGNAVCMEDFDGCGNATKCKKDADCGEGGVCWARNCCDFNVCTIPSTICANAASTHLMFQGGQEEQLQS